MDAVTTLLMIVLIAFAVLMAGILLRRRSLAVARPLSNRSPDLSAAPALDAHLKTSDQITREASRVVEQIARWMPARLRPTEKGIRFEHFIRRANGLYSEKEWSKALVAYQAALARNPDGASVLERIADLYERLGQLGNAAQVYITIANARLEQGNQAVAVDYWRRAALLDNDNLIAHIHLAAAFVAQGKIKHAVREHLTLVRVYQQRNQMLEAVQSCHAAYALDPATPHILMVIEWLRLASGLAPSSKPSEGAESVTTGIETSDHPVDVTGEQGSRADEEPFDWLAQMETPATTLEPATEPTEDTLDWVKSLQQDAVNAQSSTDELASEMPAGLIGAEPPATAASIPAAESEAEVPAWLSQLVAQRAEETALATSPSELPDGWRRSQSESLEPSAVAEEVTTGESAATVTPNDQSQQSTPAGGIDLHDIDDLAVGGDVVGRDKVAIIDASNQEEIEQHRRVEAVFPTEPVTGKIESLLVQVKLPASAIEPTVATKQELNMPFHIDKQTGALKATTFKVAVIAPGFKIHGPATKFLRVLPDRDSPVLEFQLECNTVRPGHIQVEVYAEAGLISHLFLPVSPILAPIPLPSPWLRQFNCGVILLDR